MKGAKVLGPQDVGRRVVVRRIVGIRANRPIFSDTLGHLVSLNESQLTVETATGSVKIPLVEVVRAKRVPPRRRPGRADIAALEEAAARAWPAPETERLGDWLLRAAGGWTGRANSALAVGDPGRALGTALDDIQDWYARRGLPGRVNVPLPLAAPVDAALDERGWDRSPSVLVQAVPRAELPAGPTDRVTLDDRPAADWLAVVAGFKGGLPPVAYPILTGPGHIRFAAVRDGAKLLGVARGAVTDHRLHLGLIDVAPAARRQGLASQMIRALADWATPLGAHTAYLQVQEGNPGAVALYTGLGFRTHHTYVTRTAPR